MWRAEFPKTIAAHRQKREPLLSHIQYSVNLFSLDALVYSEAGVRGQGQ